MIHHFIMYDMTVTLVSIAYVFKIITFGTILSWACFIL